MKRIISVILTIAMFLGISIETFAAYGGEKSRAYQSENCTITYSIANEWSGNQQISVSITNDGEETLRNWAVMFDNAGEITNIWNAEVCRNDGEMNTYILNTLASIRILTLIICTIITIETIKWLKR